MSDNDVYLDGVADGKRWMRDHLESTIAILRDEVKAWRDWNKKCGVSLDEGSEKCSCEDVNRVENLLNAMAETDEANALGNIMNPDTMTVDDCIAWLARDDGWTQNDLGWWKHPTRKKLEIGQYFFPYVADLKFAQMHTSSDFSIRILIEKNKVSVSAVLASNMGHADDIVLNAIAEDELTARYRIAVKCRLSTKNPSLKNES